MSDPDGIEYCPTRTDVWSNVQFANYNALQVADYSNVQYFQPSESEEEEVEAGKCLPSAIYSSFTWVGRY